MKRWRGGGPPGRSYAPPWRARTRTRTNETQPDASSAQASAPPGYRRGLRGRARPAGRLRIDGEQPVERYGRLVHTAVPGDGRRGDPEEPAAPDRVPVADRDRDAVRHGRLRRGGRGRRPVQLPGE